MGNMFDLLQNGSFSYLNGAFLVNVLWAEIKSRALTVTCILKDEPYLKTVGTHTNKNTTQ